MDFQKNREVDLRQSIFLDRRFSQTVALKVRVLFQSGLELYPNQTFDLLKIRENFENFNKKKHEAAKN